MFLITTLQVRIVSVLFLITTLQVRTGQCVVSDRHSPGKDRSVCGF